MCKKSTSETLTGQISSFVTSSEVAAISQVLLSGTLVALLSLRNGESNMKQKEIQSPKKNLQSQISPKNFNNENQVQKTVNNPAPADNKSESKQIQEPKANKLYEEKLPPEIIANWPT